MARHARSPSDLGRTHTRCPRLWCGGARAVGGANAVPAKSALHPRSACGSGSVMSIEIFITQHQIDHSGLIAL